MTQRYAFNRKLIQLRGLIRIRRIVFQKIALLVGVILVVIAAVLLIGNFGDSTFPVFLGLLGIFIIGFLSVSKKKKWLVSNK
jgi:hypothetical protein